MGEPQKIKTTSDEIKFLHSSHEMLRQMSVERWNNHDKRSEEKWGELNRELGKIDKTMDRMNGEIFATKLLISDRMGKLPCSTHVETAKWHKIFIGGAYAAVLLLLTAVAKGWIG